MHEICIAKKVSHNNVEFLDFAVDDNDNLLIFPNFKSASDFLKSEVGTGEQLLQFIITTVEAQKDNPRMQEVYKKKVVVEPEPQEPTQSQPSSDHTSVISSTKEVECYFILDCSDYEIINNDSIIDKKTNKQLVPVLAFVDLANTNELVKVPHFNLKKAFIGEAEQFDIKQNS
jgi:hypothetical protein